MALTEAGEKWVADHRDPWWRENDYIDNAEYWFRILFDEVERRADKWRTPGEMQDPAGPVFNALNEIKRELLGLR